MTHTGKDIALFALTVGVIWAAICTVLVLAIYLLYAVAWLHSHGQSLKGNLRRVLRRNFMGS